MTRAIILAAGLSTRLGALSEELPKPLLPVCDIPLIRYAVALLRGHGIAEIAVNLHHHGELIRAALGDGFYWSEEPEILGTGGGLRRIADWLTDGGQKAFVVVNGKILIDVDLSALLRRHHERDAAATMVVRQVPDAARWGAIHIDEAEHVTGLLDKGRPGRATMFTGVHAISPRLVARLPEGVSDSIRDAYIPALLDGERIEALAYDGYFHEHSTPHRYLEGNWNALSGRAALSHPPGPLTGVDPTARIDGTLIAPVRIGPGAVIERGAIVGPLAVVGSHATVAAGAHLTRVVVWPKATASGDLHDVIVTPRAVLDGSPGARDFT